MKKKDLSFEEGLTRLEELALALEDRNLSLDKALASFEEGLTLSNALRQKLDDAAGKVELLTRDLAGRPSPRTFEYDDDLPEAGDDDDQDN